MSERVTVDKGALESLKVSASPYRPNDAEFMRLRSNAIVLEASAQPIPSATHPERIEHKGINYKFLHSGLFDYDDPIQGGDVLRMPNGEIHAGTHDESWMYGAVYAGAALYREVKPRVIETTAVAGIASIVPGRTILMCAGEGLGEGTEWDVVLTERVK